MQSATNSIGGIMKINKNKSENSEKKKTKIQVKVNKSFKKAHLLNLLVPIESSEIHVHSSKVHVHGSEEKNPFYGLKKLYNMKKSYLIKMIQKLEPTRLPTVAIRHHNGWAFCTLNLKKIKNT